MKRDFTPNGKLYHRKFDELSKKPYDEKHAVDVVGLLRKANPNQMQDKPYNWMLSAYRK